MARLPRLMGRGRALEVLLGSDDIGGELAEAYGWTGLRIETPDELDDGIARMLDTDGPVMVDCRVAQLANCFPMIPSGAAHTDMILQSEEVTGEASDEAKALV